MIAPLFAAFVAFAALAAPAGSLQAPAPPAPPTPQESVVRSPHNLSAGGPGAVKAASESQVCIFCHAPHNSSPVRPLWNRAMPAEAYSIYASRSLSAKPGQPTGMSKMCLSCHDGTIALGSVLSRAAPIPMAGGVTAIPEGHARIGTDLRDDHPISFRYDAALAAKNGKLAAPNALPPQLKLDANAEMQCTTCHDAHNNALGDFLVMRNDNAEMCRSCHQVGKTSIAAHANCGACHQSHSAPSGPHLLKKATVTDTCIACHDGSTPLAANIAADLHKRSSHDTRSPVDAPPPLSQHVGCADCHEPHTMASGSARPPGIAPNFGKVKGRSASGADVAAASSEFEVCFKCHADGSVDQPWIARRISQANTRLQFSPGAISYHPVEAPGRNANVPSLRPGLTTASRIACTSCHASDSASPLAAAGLGLGPKGAGGAPAGLHGSSHEPNLVLPYETRDYTTESAQAYALCYACHDRASILDNRSFPGHKLHIVDQRTACAACHDAHGIASSQGTSRGNSKLINFQTGVVLPERATGRLEYIDQGAFQSQCFLSCHGSNHAPKSYPIAPAPFGRPQAAPRPPGR